MWYFVYNFILLPVLDLVLRIASLFNGKIREGISGRKNLFNDLEIKLAGLDRTKKIIWFHSSSMGEFEQAKPIIEKIKNEMDVNILVTFFSPSGYKNSLKYPYADLITYLPFDYSAQMERFISNVRPSLVILMRYDIWPNMIWQLKKVSVPVFIVDATMRSDSKRGIPLSRSFHKKIFCDITEILTVSDKDALNFTKFDIPVERVKSVGDTRFDRVYQKSLVAMNKKIFSKELFSGKKVIVLGSTWEADEEVMLPALLKLSEKAQDIRIVLVPHEPTIQRLEQLELQLKGKISIIRFSLLNNYKDEKVIIIDTIGILLTLYYYADMAYVGGSFRQGIHNVLEPAVYGIPVLFGPKIENSQEAQKMVNLGSGIVIRNKKEAFDKLDQLVTNTEEMSRLGQISKQYILDNIGATDKIMSEIKKYIS